MGKIRARVSQGGGEDSGASIATLGIVRIKVSLNPEDQSTTVPTNISCSLAVGQGSAQGPDGAGTQNTNRGIDLFYTYNVVGGTSVGQAYTLSDFQNWNIADVDDTTGKVSVSLAAEADVVLPPRKAAGAPRSFWGRILAFLRRIFGLKA